MPGLSAEKTPFPSCEMNSTSTFRWSWLSIKSGSRKIQKHGTVADSATTWEGIVIIPPPTPKYFTNLGTLGMYSENSGNASPPPPPSPPNIIQAAKLTFYTFSLDKKASKIIWVYLLRFSTNHSSFSLLALCNIWSIKWEQGDMKVQFAACLTWYPTSERRKRGRFRVEHGKRNFISLSSHVLFCLLHKQRTLN